MVMDIGRWVIDRTLSAFEVPACTTGTYEVSRRRHKLGLLDTYPYNRIRCHIPEP